MDTWMIERTWFARMEQKGKTWSSECVPSSKRYQDIKKKCKKDADRCSLLYYIFLSRAPLTFGHSQLVLRVQDNVKHDELFLFDLAAPIIKHAISAFRQVLHSDKVHMTEDFASLAELTLAKDAYLKTLILRTSAEEHPLTQEDPLIEYKVHLVPYFESNALECQKRYLAIHRVGPKEKGGLLGWLGERETAVEKWQLKSETPWACILDEVANTNLNMPKLAELLAKAWPSKV